MSFATCGEWRMGWTTKDQSNVVTVKQNYYKLTAMNDSAAQEPKML